MNLTGQTKILTDYGRYEMFEIINATFSKIYNPSENLAIDESYCSVQGKGDFQTVPTKET